jgi:hypothetical protein
MVKALMAESADSMVEPDPFWAFFEEKPETLATDGEVVGVIGIVFGLLSTAGQIMISAWPVFQFGFYGLPMILWHVWVEVGVLLLLFTLQIWGLVVHVRSTDQPNAATTFRAWRVNFLANFIGFLVAIASNMLWLVWQVMYNTAPSTIQHVPYIWRAIGYKVLAAIAFWMTFTLKDFYFEYDPEGALRNQDFCMFCDGADEFDENHDHENDVHDESSTHSHAL